MTTKSQNLVEFKTRKAYSFESGIETASFVGARVLKSLPSVIRTYKFIEFFKQKMITDNRYF